MDLNFVLPLKNRNNVPLKTTYLHTKSVYLYGNSFYGNRASYMHIHTRGLFATVDSILDDPGSSGSSHCTGIIFRCVLIAQGPVGRTLISIFDCNLSLLCLP